MKRIITLCIFIVAAITGLAQTDTTGTKNPPESDTIRVGGMIIIRKPGSKDREMSDREVRIKSRRTEKPSRVSTNWWIIDLGFSNFVDNTNYSSAGAQQYAPGSNESWFELKDWKSRNVNIWFFMQRLNVAKHVLNLKYGLGLELNNYRFKQPVRFTDNPLAVVNPPIVTYDVTANRTYEKNKLAADYLTVPIMVNLNFTPGRSEGFGLSFGVSAGYLYSARNKTITSDEGKKKAKDDFDLEKFKLSYIGELSLGPVKLYGSYAIKNMFGRGLDMTPYNFGFRFANW